MIVVYCGAGRGQALLRAGDIVKFAPSDEEEEDEVCAPPPTCPRHDIVPVTIRV